MLIEGPEEHDDENADYAWWKCCSFRIHTAASSPSSSPWQGKTHGSPRTPPPCISFVESTSYSRRGIHSSLVRFSVLRQLQILLNPNSCADLETFRETGLLAYQYHFCGFRHACSQQLKKACPNSRILLSALTLHVTWVGQIHLIQLARYYWVAVMCQALCQVSGYTSDKSKYPCLTECVLPLPHRCR